MAVPVANTAPPGLLLEPSKHKMRQRDKGTCRVILVRAQPSPACVYTAAIFPSSLESAELQPFDLEVHLPPLPQCSQTPCSLPPSDRSHNEGYSLSIGLHVPHLDHLIQPRPPSSHSGICSLGTSPGDCPPASSVPVPLQGHSFSSIYPVGTGGPSRCELLLATMVNSKHATEIFMAGASV